MTQLVEIEKLMFSNIFVLRRGRCGSTIFSKACTHFTSHTSGDESKNSLLGHDRFAYPAFHIEVDNRLSWLLGRLGKQYGDTAFYRFCTLMGAKGDLQKALGEFDITCNASRKKHIFTRWF